VRVRLEHLVTGSRQEDEINLDITGVSCNVVERTQLPQKIIQ
jgi:hypothetical protein